MEFQIVVKELLFQQYFFYWFIPFTCWILQSSYRVYFGDGLYFWQEDNVGDDILDYEA